MTSGDLTATRRELLAGAAIAAGAAVLPVSPASADPRRRAKPDHVILVDWDGFGSDLLGRVPMPNLQALVDRGSLSVADSTYNTYSNSARASMSNRSAPEGSRHRDRPGAAFATRVDVAIDILNRRPVDSAGQQVTVPRVPAFLAVYAGEIDGLLHEEGPGSTSLPPLLAAYDRDLGRLVQAVRDAGARVGPAPLDSRAPVSFWIWSTFRMSGRVISR